MNQMRKEARERSRLKKGIKGSSRRPLTIKERVADLEHKQYQKGDMIFATQYTTIHKCAETNNLSGLSHFLRTEDVDAKDRWGDARCPGFLAVRAVMGVVSSTKDDF